MLALNSQISACFCLTRAAIKFKGVHHHTGFQHVFYSPSLEKQVRNLRQELKQRLWKSTAYRLVPHGFLSLLHYTACTGKELPPVRWTLTHQSLTKEMPLLSCLQVIYRGSFSIKGSQMTLPCVKWQRTNHQQQTYLQNSKNSNLNLYI